MVCKPNQFSADSAISCLHVSVLICLSICLFVGVFSMIPLCSHIFGMILIVCPCVLPVCISLIVHICFLPSSVLIIVWHPIWGECFTLF